MPELHIQYMVNVIVIFDVQINFCVSPKKTESFNVPMTYALHSETQEAAALIINQSFSEFLTKFEPYIQSIHITDQYTGLKEDYRYSTIILTDMVASVAPAGVTRGELSCSVRFLMCTFGF